MANSPVPATSVSIIVPTLNEEENIAPLVSRITACAVPFEEILFVDSNSTDNTRREIHDLSQKRPVRLVEQNGAEPGLAGAIISGARSAKGEVLLVMDADLSHPPERINDLLALVLADAADLVVGSRYVKGGSTPGWPIWRRIISRAGAALAYPLTGLHDSMCGFFAIRRSRLLDLAPQTSGFKIVFEMMVRDGGRMRVREIPIAFRERVRGKSKMSFSVALSFFVRWVWAILQRLLGRACDRSEAASSARGDVPVAPKER